MQITKLYQQPVYSREFNKETFEVLFDIEVAAGGYEGMYGPGSSTPPGLAGATIKEGTIEKTVSSHEAKSFNSFEPSSSEAKGLHGQVFSCKLCKVEAENAEEAIKFAGEIYGKKGTLGAVPKEAKVLEYKKA